MILLEVRGRLGNQLFRYAAARKILHDRGDKENCCSAFSPSRARTLMMDGETGLKISMCAIIEKQIRQ